mgnify:CR=1
MLYIQKKFRGKVKFYLYSFRANAEFTVSVVIDGDTFKVKNGWKWDNKTGDTVYLICYNITPKMKENMKKQKNDCQT